MDWNAWHRGYDTDPALQARLRVVSDQIAQALEASPAGPIRVISVCAGDGRDVIGALRQHPRRADVTAWLLDHHAESLVRGRTDAAQAGLAAQLRFIETDAALGVSYNGVAPADVLIISGFLGHLHVSNVPSFLAALPMLCRPGGRVIWSRHLRLNQGATQVPVIRRLLEAQAFHEVRYEEASQGGFAVGSAQFVGATQPLDPARVLFKFIGLDQLE